MKCFIEGCNEISRTKIKPGPCSRHYNYKRKNGHYGPPTGVYRQDVLSYEAAHHRIKVARGKASEYLCCCGCGQQAKEWAYAGNCEKEITTLRKNSRSKKLDEVRFSPNPEMYQPMAVDCHRRHDNGIP